jgi:hypothetical protein
MGFEDVRWINLAQDHTYPVVVFGIAVLNLQVLAPYSVVNLVWVGVQNTIIFHLAQFFRYYCSFSCYLLLLKSDLTCLDSFSSL